jgi:hypothetical protein
VSPSVETKCLPCFSKGWIAFFCIHNLKCQKKGKTKFKDIVYNLHLYFNSLSYLRNTSKEALSSFVKIIHTTIRDCWILKYKPKRLICRKVCIAEFIKENRDETQLKIDSFLIWLLVVIEPTKDKEIL